jgi:hypothetical protein
MVCWYSSLPTREPPIFKLIAIVAKGGREVGEFVFELVRAGLGHRQMPAQPGHLPTSANNALPGASAAMPAVPVLTNQQAEHQVVIMTTDCESTMVKTGNCFVYIYTYIHIYMTPDTRDHYV